MRSYDALFFAHKNLWRRTGRTVLTLLGVMIGTASIIVMLSLGIGLVESQKKTMAQWGSLNIIRVNETHSYPGDPNAGNQKKLTDSAVTELKAMDGVLGVSPAFNVWGDAKWGKKRGGITLIGIDPELMEFLEFDVSAGRLLTMDDRFNVVAGAQVVNNFWDEKMRPGPWQEMPKNDALQLLNQRLSMTVFNQKSQKRIYNLNVVGILTEKNAERSWEVYGNIKEIKKIRDFMNQGRQEEPVVYMQKSEEAIKSPGRVPGKPSGGKKPKQEDQYNFALVRTKDVSDTRRISKLLREQGYNAWSIADNLDGIEQSARRFQAILGGIGAITLLVAAIGITNTMVMSIYERTREIAIMKVVGASFFDIRRLFLAESSLIGVIGGTLGIALSFLLSALLNKYGGSFINPGGMMMGPEALQISLIPPWLVGFALLFSFCIGLVSGIYPANRAIRLDPITTMRQG